MASAVAATMAQSEEKSAVLLDEDLQLIETSQIPRHLVMIAIHREKPLAAFAETEEQRLVVLTGDVPIVPGKSSSHIRHRLCLSFFCAYR